MSKNSVPARERIASSFQQLSIASKSLESASAELGGTIDGLNAALNKLNLGVSAWHQVAGHVDDYYNFWTREIGYARSNGQWSIVLRRTEGNHEAPERQETESWPFNEAPHWMQVESVGKIPDLLDDLIKRTEDTTQKIKNKTKEAKDLAVGLGTQLLAQAKEASRSGDMALARKLKKQASEMGVVDSSLES